MRRRFISCDWGTTTSRVRLADATTGARLAETCSDAGVAALHRAWTEHSGDGVVRELFFLQSLRGQLERLASIAGENLDGLPVVISGMASATVGLRELPYRTLPFPSDGCDLVTSSNDATPEFPHPWLLISGARGSDDVMRGEEVQVVGAALIDPDLTHDCLVILPGTHSKHVGIAVGQVLSVRTFMTGEFFDLLSRHSILADSLDDGPCEPAAAEAAFVAGVRLGAERGVLSASFQVRVGMLSGMRSRSESRHFLSGLVHGAELRTLRSEGRTIAVVAEGAAAARYVAAIRELGSRVEVRVVSAAAAVVEGQRHVARCVAKHDPHWEGASCFRAS